MLSYWIKKGVWLLLFTVKPVSSEFVSFYNQLPSNHLTHSLRPPLSSNFLLTRELQSESLLACEEVCGELQADSVEGAVGIWGQSWATKLPQQDPSILGPIPDPKHVMDILRVENQEMQTVKDRDKAL